MHRYKKIILGAALAVSAGMTSCNDYFEVEDTNRLTEEQVLTGENGLKNITLAMYQFLTAAGWRYGEYVFAPQNMRGDDMTGLGGFTQYNYLTVVSEFQNSPAGPELVNNWNNRYNSINQANQLLSFVGKVGLSDERVKVLTSEARAVRAYAHFELYKNFHKIVIKHGSDVSEPTPTTDRVKSLEIIINELEESYGDLPVTWDDANYGRFTRGAALSYLAHAYLYKKDWAKAEEVLKKVIALGVYDLEDNFRSLFDGSNEASVEIIFANRYTAEISGGLERYHNLSVSNDPDGWNMWRPSDFLTSEFQKEKQTSGALDSRVPGTINIPEVTKDYSRDIPTFSKYYGGGESNSGIDIIQMRYADVLLMLAEALNEQGKADEALLNLNKVRNRADLPNFTKKEKNNLFSEIKRQRLLEFTMEGKRFYDLVRWGNPEKTLEANGKKGIENFKKGVHEFLPIPKSEVDTNPNIEPTPGF